MTKGEDKQLFAPVPLRAMAFDLSGLQLRVLVCVAAHDRLSLAIGKGQGCRASNERMKTMVGCNYSRICSTLTELVDLGFLQREKLGRHTIYRVVYSDDDRLLFSNVSVDRSKGAERATPEGDDAHSPAPISCQEASERAPIGCRDFANYPSFSPETASQYIPLNGGIDSVETGEEYSSEEAHRELRDPVRSEGIGKENRLKAGHPRTAFADNVGGQMAQLARAMNAGDPVNKLAWYEWLGENAVCHENGALSGQAIRLADLLVESMTDDEYQRWQDGSGLVEVAA